MSEATEQGVQVDIIPLTEPDALYQHYPRESDPQPAMLTLNLEDGELTARYNPAIGGGMPESVYHRRVLWFDLPRLTAAVANELFETVKPIAQRLLNGSEIVWDGDNHVGRLDPVAWAAYDELVAECAAENFDTQHMVDGLDATEWYSTVSSGEVIHQFDLFAGTTDAEIAEKAAAEEEAMKTGGEAGYTVLSGVEEYLTALRDELRDAEYARLKEIAGKIAELTEERDELVSQVRGWNVKSDREIGELIGKSHTTVREIDKRIRKEQQGDTPTDGREVIVELYRGTALGSVGEELGLSDVTLDDATWEWLAEQGYDEADTDYWINIVDADEPLHNNNPVARTTMTVKPTADTQS